MSVDQIARVVRASALALFLPAPVEAQTEENNASPIALAASYTGDLVVAGGPGRSSRPVYLDNLQLSADFDMERIAAWRGVTARVNVLNNFGKAPNDSIGTLQGVDNIEVAERRLRLYEAWIEKRLGDAGYSVRVGLYDINSDFYVTPAASQLVMPPFGVGSELAASGPNGPSTYPLTALGIRGRAVVGGHSYVMAALVNAEVGVVNAWQSFKGTGKASGLMLLESGVETDRGKIAAGVWRYTQAQPVYPPSGVEPDGSTVKANGAYVLAQYRLSDASADRPVVHAFTRFGVADGRTTPFGGGGQLGALIEHPFAGRPDGALSLGVNTGRITRIHRRVPAGVQRPPRAETAVELTYADKIAPYLTIQPDFQYVFRSASVDGGRPVVVALLRTRVEWSRP